MLKIHCTPPSSAAEAMQSLCDVFSLDVCIWFVAGGGKAKVLFYGCTMTVKEKRSDGVCCRQPYDYMYLQCLLAIC